MIEEKRGESVSRKPKKMVGLVALGIFAIFSCLVGWFIGVPMIRLAKDPAQFRQTVGGYGLWGKLIFVGMVVLQVVVAFIPGEPIELAAGYAFGFWEGTALTMAGFLVGSWIVFALVRKFGVRLVEVFFKPERMEGLFFLKNPQKAETLVFLLMVIPGTPKDFLSYFAGLTPLTLGKWLVIVLIARIPSLVTSTATGAAAGQSSYLLAAVMFALSGVFAGVGVVSYRRICRRQNQSD